MHVPSPVTPRRPMAEALARIVRKVPNRNDYVTKYIVCDRFMARSLCNLGYFLFDFLWFLNLLCNTLYVSNF